MFFDLFAYENIYSILFKDIIFRCAIANNVIEAFNFISSGYTITLVGLFVSN